MTVLHVAPKGLSHSNKLESLSRDISQIIMSSGLSGGMEEDSYHPGIGK